MNMTHVTGEQYFVGGVGWSIRPRYMPTDEEVHDIEVGYDDQGDKQLDYVGGVSRRGVCRRGFMRG